MIVFTEVVHAVKCIYTLCNLVLFPQKFLNYNILIIMFPMTISLIGEWMCAGTEAIH